MKKRVLSVLLASVMVLGAMLTGCNKEKEPEEEAKEPVPMEPALPSASLEGSTLVWSMGSQPENCDPSLYTTALEASILNNVMEGLYRMKDGEAQPALADGQEERTENEDGTVTYTYRLRAAKWSDGQPVKAQDFVYGWNRAASQEKNSPYNYLFGYIATEEPAEDAATDAQPKMMVEAQGDDTLKVTLRGDVPYFTQLLTLPAFFPLREDAQADALSNGAVFNGPFTVGEITKGEELILEKNPEYRAADEVSLDYVVGKILKGESGEWEAKNVQVGVPTAENQSQAEAVEFCGTQYLLINSTTDVEALRNEKVRQALSLAIDRTMLAEETLGGGAAPAKGLVPTVAGGIGEFLSAKADMEAAKALLAEANVAEENLQLELLAAEDETSQAVAEAVASMWEELGFTVTVTAQPAEQYQESLTRTTYPAVALSGWYGDCNDPAEFLNVFVSLSQSSFNGYSSLEYNKAILEAFGKTGADRLTTMSAAEEILLNDGYVIPLYHGAILVASGEEAENWQVDSRGIYWFGDASVGE